MEQTSIQRNIVLVTQQIISEIPESEVRLKKKLIYYIQSLWNLAPEVLNSGSVWIPVQDILNSYIKADIFYFSMFSPFTNTKPLF